MPPATHDECEATRLQTASQLVATAARWRTANPEHRGGVVLVWQGSVYGWKDCLRDPHHEQPGAYAVDASGHVYIAGGGNEYDGAEEWSRLGEELWTWKPNP